ncbi:MAG: molybdopterin-dependent oxidoreductase [bacterium]|nr:molybdopterin-dependent oxidoreductase [bacterium]
MAVAKRGSEPQSTACVLCSLNCGVTVEVEDGHLTKIRGDREHPISQGYQCQKASRLDFYQNAQNRLRSPLKRREDGTFEEISWDTAIREIAAELVRLRDEHGGHSLAYYGGGGQGNHLGGVYGSVLRAAMGTRYIYTSLAQEKTGGFWLDGRLYGRQTCHPSEDVHNADYVLFIGTNPWQSHGIPQARKVINALARDAERTMVVIDPRVSETAKKADVHLQVRPGGDAHLLLAMLGTIVQEDLADQEFLEARTTGFEELRELLTAVPVDEYARLAGLDAEAVREVARSYAGAEAACVRTDLGLEHSPHSTLNLYLAKLLYLITGNFGKKGGNNFHTFLLPLIGHSKEPGEGGAVTRVTGMREISKLFPPNILPAEIDTDHPERVRGVVVDSSNPLITAADTDAYRQAFSKLELLVVIDVAMTETASLAHYVLPAASQYEKWEATFFNLEFPANFFHLRRPLFEPAEGTLAEPEIYRRLAAAMGALPERFPILERIARFDRRRPRWRLFPAALATALKLRPKWKSYLSAVLHETLGKALPDDARAAAVLWGGCQFYARRHAEAVRRAGIEDQGDGLGEALFERVLNSRSGTLLSVHRYEDTWKFLRHADGKIHLAIPEMLRELEALEPPTLDEDFPLVLAAGERRSYNANTIVREEAWRKRDPHGALRLHPLDAGSLGLEDGDWALCESRRGQVRVQVEISGEVLPGVASLPHGFGLREKEGEDASIRTSGPAINELTSAAHCDELAKTPFHKHIPVRISAAAEDPR